MVYKQPELARIRTHEKIANAEPIMLTLIWYVWVPRTVSQPLISAFAAGDLKGHGPQPAQHDRPLWPSDSPTCCSPAC
jgi:hypothetical protein